MTPLRLQDELVNELTTLFAGKILKNEQGELAPFHIYRQWLPKEDGETTVFPFIRVILDYGKDPSEEDPQLCYMRVEAGTWDDDPEFQGHLDLMNVLSAIYRYLMVKRYVGEGFELTYPVRWMVKPESDFPKFYGMLKVRWNIPKVTIDDILS